MVLSKEYKTENSVVLGHPFIKDVLCYDVETDSLDVETAQVKFIGCYSYRTQKYYVFCPWELEKFQVLLNSHRVTVGFNNKSFDGPILTNNGFDLNFKVVVDCLRVLYDKERKRPNREIIIKHNGKPLSTLLKNRKLRTIAETLGFSTLKGDIDYNIFKKERFSQVELDEIVKYLVADVDVTRQLFEYLLVFFDNFRDYVSEDNVKRFNYLRSSSGSYTYDAICHMAKLPYVYEDDPVKLKVRPVNHGGYVLSPKREFSEGVIVYKDFSSLYPRIYYMCNLNSHSCTCCSSEEKWTGGGFYDVAGAYCSKKRGIVESIICDVYYKRAKYKEEGDSRELALKTMMNSFYGINGSPVFKSLFNLHSPGDCTSIGRRMVQYAIKYFESKGIEVIYADTDSVFLVLPKGMTLQELDVLCVEVVEYLLGFMPFPDYDFSLKTDDVFSKLWLHSKKFYMGINEKNKLVVKGHQVIKSDCSIISKKVFSKIKKEILKRRDVKFDEEYIKGLVNDAIKEDIGLVGKYYSVRSISSYASKSSIQAQISDVLGEGVHLLIPNRRVGRIGKSKKYATLEESEDVDVGDLDLGNVWKELSPFIRDWVSEDVKEKAERDYNKKKEKELQDYFNSDLFDSEAVGSDISNEEYYENEIWFEVNE